jgi:hypothetical protein
VHDLSAGWGSDCTSGSVWRTADVVRTTSIRADTGGGGENAITVAMTEMLWPGGAETADELVGGGAGDGDESAEGGDTAGAGGGGAGGGGAGGGVGDGGGGEGGAGGGVTGGGVADGGVEGRAGAARGSTGFRAARLGTWRGSDSARR